MLAVFWHQNLAGLVLIAAFSATSTHAARPYQLRPGSSLVLPPALDGISDGDLPRSLGSLKFTLRHVYHHGVQLYPHLHRFLDVPVGVPLESTSDYGATVEDAPDFLEASVQTMKLQRLSRRNHSDIDALLDYAYLHSKPADLSAMDWVVDEVASPNITDKKTVITFAKMAANAYVLSPALGKWQPVKGGFNYTDDFGWEADGLRGHIFADETNKTVVIGLKGTSPAVFDGADTTGNDKLNDNLFGSCCCGQGGSLSWKQVCNCMTGTYSCNSTCLVTSLREKGHYYRSVRELYSNVTARYPTSDVWLSGHSLGGVVSALLGLTYGLPTLTYEAFPDAMAASRLGLPTPPGFRIGAHHTRFKTGVHHFGHTADPIFMGNCNGGFSFCSIAGYAFQGLCHTGETCIYDTVNDFGWRVGIGTHKIDNVIRDVLEKYETVPSCEADVDCQDCALWKFYESNGTETTTSAAPTSTPHTRTRTETCRTPGWWGCLDETTTLGPTATPSTSATCRTPGWFGCNDPTTTTALTTTETSLTATPAPTVTTTSIPTSTATCKTPGWFGCNDPTTTTIPPTRTSSQATMPAPIATATCDTPGWFGCNDSTQTRPITSNHSLTSITPAPTDTDKCTSREWFGLICVDPSPTSTTAKPTPINPPMASRKTCIHRHWYGPCKEWLWEDFSPETDL